MSYKDADAQRLFMAGEAAIFYGGPVKLFWSEESISDKIDVMDPMQGPSAENRRPSTGRTASLPTRRSIRKRR